MAGKRLQIAAILLSSVAESTLVVTSSNGFRVKTDGHVNTHLHSEPQIIPAGAVEGKETEVDNSIYLPRVMVRSIHNSAVKRGDCFAAEEDSENISCSCHAKEQSNLPTIYVSQTAEKEGEQVTKMLKPRDYLGAPFLQDYQVMCKSLLTDSQSDNVIMSSSLLSTLEESEEVVSRMKKSSVRTRLFGFGSDYVPNTGTIEQNLKDQEICMGVIAIFLLAIYTYLVFKKRKRLNKDAKEKARLEEEQKFMEDDLDAEPTGTENSPGPALRNQKTTNFLKLIKSQTKNHLDLSGGSRTSSKSSFVRSNRTSEQMKKDVGDTSSRDSLSRLSTDKVVNRYDSMNAAKKGSQEAKDADSSDNLTAMDYLSKIEEEKVYPSINE